MTITGCLRGIAFLASSFFNLFLSLIQAAKNDLPLPKRKTFPHPRELAARQQQQQQQQQDILLPQAQAQPLIIQDIEEDDFQPVLRDEDDDDTDSSDDEQKTTKSTKYELYISGFLLSIPTGRG